MLKENVIRDNLLESMFSRFAPTRVWGVETAVLGMRNSECGVRNGENRMPITITIAMVLPGSLAVGEWVREKDTAVGNGIAGGGVYGS